MTTTTRGAGRFGAGAALRLAFCVALCFVPGIFGALFNPGGPGDWYAGLAKPALTPPGWIFPVVWPLLYAMMGVALFLALSPSRRDAPRWPLAVFAVQLVLNGLWSWLFFGLERADLALVDIALLLAAIVAAIAGFRQRRAAAAWLLVPYLAWVSFATWLNLEIVRLNG